MQNRHRVMRQLDISLTVPILEAVPSSSSVFFMYAGMPIYLFVSRNRKKKKKKKKNRLTAMHIAGVLRSAQSTKTKQSKTKSSK